MGVQEERQMGRGSPLKSNDSGDATQKIALSSEGLRLNRTEDISGTINLIMATRYGTVDLHVNDRDGRFRRLWVEVPSEAFSKAIRCAAGDKFTATIECLEMPGRGQRVIAFNP